MMVELPESAAHVATDPNRVYYVGAGGNPCRLPGVLSFHLTRPCLRLRPSLRSAHNMLDGLRQGLVRTRTNSASWSDQRSTSLAPVYTTSDRPVLARSQRITRYFLASFCASGRTTAWSCRPPVVSPTGTPWPFSS